MIAGCNGSCCTGTGIDGSTGADIDGCTRPNDCSDLTSDCVYTEADCW